MKANFYFGTEFRCPASNVAGAVVIQPVSHSQSRHPFRYRAEHRAGGFTLVEMLVALVLLALSGVIVFGSINLANETWDRGEAKSEQSREMRLAAQFLRATLNAAQPIRLNGAGESALPFAGANDSVMFPALLPERIGGGLYYFRLALTPAQKNAQLTLARVLPRYDSKEPPDFAQADISILADGIQTLKVQYYGSPNQPGPDLVQPTWGDRWDDAQQWPDMIRLNVVPAGRPEWPPLIIELKLAGQTVCDEIRRAHNQCDAY